MIRKFFLLFFAVNITAFSYANLPAKTVLKAHKKVLLIMATRFEFTAVSEDDELALKAIDAGIKEVQRVEALISEWQPTSQTSAINRNAGIKPVVVDQELYDLIARSKRVSELTNGAFDISFAAVDKIWKFDGSMKEMPSPEKVKASVKNIGYQKIILNPQDHSVFLQDKGMKLGFGGIGQGFGVDKAQALMQQMGIKSGVVNASGDVSAWGKQPDGKSWFVGIGDPNEKDKVFSWLAADETAIVTSGNYEKYVEFNGIRYGHIIDPRTGYPVLGMKSVTIICPNVELADALATGIFVMGKDAGLKLINQLKGVNCVMITDKDEMLTSEGLKLNFYKGKEYQQELDKKNNSQNSIGK